jgi:alanine dehydrogenase
MGFSEEDYLKLEPKVVFTTHKQVYQQDIVLLIRYPSDEEVKYMRPGPA